jgi:thioredoxin 1
MSLITNVVKGGSPERVLLLVHGLGADERDLGGLLPYLDPDGHFATVLPRGLVSAPPGFAWYEWAPDGRFDAAGFATSLEALDDLLDEACAEHGLARDEAVVGGFSQGAGMMLTLALRRSERPRPAAVLAMSPALPGLDAIDVDWEGAKTLPVLVQHGTGVPIVYSEYPMAHQVALESVQQARGWLDAVRAGEQPSEPVPEDPPEGPVKAVNTATFDTEVLASDVPVIVDFWAPWCGPCRQVSPIVEQIAVMREGAYKVVKINIDEEPALAQRYEVQSIPMIGLFRDGRLERSSLGAKPRPQLEADLGMLVIP